MRGCVGCLFRGLESGVGGTSSSPVGGISDADLCRFTPGHGYLEALVADNAEVVTEEITEISERGLHTLDGKTYDVDIIVCATGFNTSFCPNFHLIGTSPLSRSNPYLGIDGTDLQDEWKDEAKAYLSIMASGYPNYFSQSPLAPSISSI